MNKQARNTSLINMGINPNSISTEAELAKGIDISKIFTAGAKAIEQKLKDDQDMLQLQLKGESERVHQKYRMLLSDKNLYKDPKKLEQVKKEYEQERNAINARISSQLSENRRAVLTEYDKTTFNGIEGYSDLLYKEQKFNEQQSEINTRLYELNDRAISASYQGEAGLLEMGSSFDEFDHLLSSQVESKFMDQTQAYETFSNSLASAALTSNVIAAKNGIIKGNMSYEDKMLVLNAIKEQYKNPEFIRNLAKEAAKGYANTNEDTLIVKMSKKVNEAINLINQDINQLNAMENIKKINAKKEENLDLIERRKYNELLAQNAWEAHSYKVTKEKKSSPYGNNFVFNYVNSEKLYGVKGLQFEKGTVPYKQLTTEANQSLENLISNPFENLGYTPGSITNEQLMDETMERAFAIAGADLGLSPNTIEERVEIAKFLIGQNIRGGIFPEGMDYNMTLMYADPTSLVMTPSEFERNKRKYANAYVVKSYEGLSDQVLSMPVGKGATKTQEEKRNTQIMAAQAAGIAFPKTVIDGDDDITMFNKGRIFSEVPANNQIAKTVINRTVSEFFEANNIDPGEGNINLITTNNLIASAINNDVNLNAIEENAISYYNIDNRQAIMSSQGIVEITKADLNNFKYFGKAVEDFVWEELNKQFNFKDRLLGGTTINYVKPKMVEID